MILRVLSCKYRAAQTAHWSARELLLWGSAVPKPAKSGAGQLVLSGYARRRRRRAARHDVRQPDTRLHGVRGRRLPGLRAPRPRPESLLAPRPYSQEQQPEQSADRYDLPGRGDGQHRDPISVGSACPARAWVERGREASGLDQDQEQVIRRARHPVELAQCGLGSEI